MTRLPLPAPYFSLARAARIPCAVWWKGEELRRVEGPEGFTTWREADEASRFLAGRLAPAS